MEHYGLGVLIFNIKYQATELAKDLLFNLEQKQIGQVFLLALNILQELRKMEHYGYGATIIMGN